jgi:hypothetical protein
VWREVLERQIAAAEADVVRSFDGVLLDAATQRVSEELWDLAHELGERSPLFALVWTELKHHSRFTGLGHPDRLEGDPVTVGHLVRRRARVKPDGLEVRCQEGLPEPRPDRVDDGDSWVFVDGADMEVLAPGCWSRIHALSPVAVVPHS